MSKPVNRRGFLRTTAASSALLGLGDLSFLSGLPAVRAAETRLPGQVVRMRPEIEPLVRFLEETPRPRLLEETATRIRKGLNYRDLLAALLLAGVRNVEPRPQVGFKFHSVLVVNSAHLASLASPDSERWLPIFWALDYFKVGQAKNIEERQGWRMAAVDEKAVPPARKARQALIDALEKWDAEAADSAIASLVRNAGADEVFEIFWRYSPRDFRSIGHKAIFAANSRRTLDTIGWQHAEPVLRSLTYALMMAGANNPATSDDPADRPGRRNRERLREIRESWLEGKDDPAATAEMLAVLRQGSDEDAAGKTIELLNKGISPQAIWDAILVGSTELLMRKVGILSLHALTTTNAIRFAYDTSASDETRRWLLLQNASFIPLFRKEIEKQGKIPELQIEQVEPVILKGKQATIEQIFADLGKDRLQAARLSLGILDQEGMAEKFMDVARLLVFLKGNDAHDYKFSSAVLEDYYKVSPKWRSRFLAGNLFYLRGSSDPDNSLVQRTRAALKS